MEAFGNSRAGMCFDSRKGTYVDSRARMYIDSHSNLVLLDSRLGLARLNARLGEVQLLAARLLESGRDVVVPEHYVAVDSLHIVGRLLKGLLLVAAKLPVGLNVGNCYDVVADNVGTCKSRVTSAQCRAGAGWQVS